MASVHVYRGAPNLVKVMPSHIRCTSRGRHMRGCGRAAGGVEPINASCINVRRYAFEKRRGSSRHSLTEPKYIYITHKSHAKSNMRLYIVGTYSNPGADIRNTSSNALATHNITQTTTFCLSSEEHHAYCICVCVISI